MSPRMAALFSSVPGGEGLGLTARTMLRRQRGFRTASYLPWRWGCRRPWCRDQQEDCRVTDSLSGAAHGWHDLGGDGYLAVEVDAGFGAEDEMLDAEGCVGGAAVLAARAREVPGRAAAAVTSRTVVASFAPVRTGAAGGDYLLCALEVEGEDGLSSGVGGGDLTCWRDLQCVLRQTVRGWCGGCGSGCAGADRRDDGVGGVCSGLEVADEEADDLIHDGTEVAVAAGAGDELQRSRGRDDAGGVGVEGRVGRCGRDSACPPRLRLRGRRASRSGGLR